MMILEIEDEKYTMIPNEEYHSRDELSASQIKTLLNNPYEFLHPQEISSKNLDIGSALHKLVLEKEDFYKEFAVAPDANKRTIAGREEFEDFMEANKGKRILTKQDFELCEAMAEAVLQSPSANILQGGVAEASFFGEIDGVKTRCRPDYYNEDLGLVIDLKTTDDASPDAFSKTIANYGYYIQAPFYLDTLKSAGYKADKFLFVVVSKKEPHMVGFYTIDQVAMDFGRSEYKRAFEIYKNIKDYDVPFFKDMTTGEVVQTLTLPNYAFYKKDAKLI
ncbi:MAG TPA: hypothetical protein ENN12_05650 [Epsilonproteobacteria bacterium]|nr:hypothetical protein [Campylobacterota bacterium]